MRLREIVERKALIETNTVHAYSILGKLSYRWGRSSQLPQSGEQQARLPRMTRTG